MAIPQPPSSCRLPCLRSKHSVEYEDGVVEVVDLLAEQVEFEGQQPPPTLVSVLFADWATPPTILAACCSASY